MSEKRNGKIYRVTLLGSIVNVVLVMLKFFAGVWGSSAAMIADAVHSLSDFLTDVIVIVFVKLSSKPADDDHRYGHGKYETIATSIIGLALFFVAILLGWNGIEKICMAVRGEHLESPGMVAFVAAIASIVMKEWIFQVSHRVAKETDSKVLGANAWHHRSDALSSIGTAVGIGGAILLGADWAVLDPVAAVIVSMLIVVTALKLLRQASGELLEECLPKATENRIREIVCQDKSVRDIHNLRTRRIGETIAIEMHLRLPGTISLEESHNHATAIEKALRKEFGSGTYITLHIEPIKNASK